MSHAHDLAWAAGFFDGEGFVVIQERSSKNNGKVYRGYYLRVAINHVNPKPLYEMQRLFGGTVRKQLEHKVVGNRHARHTWQTSCKVAKECLIQMMPYLRNKQDVAALGIELQNTMGNHGQRTTPELQEKRKSLKSQISALNAKD